MEGAKKIQILKANGRQKMSFSPATTKSTKDSSKSKLGESKIEQYLKIFK